LLTAIREDRGGRFVFRSGLVIHSYDGFGSGVILEQLTSFQYGSIPYNSTVIDIGAHIGTFTLQAAKAHPLNCIYAYEPLPTNFKILKKNIQSNNFNERIFCFPYAVSGKRGLRQLAQRGSPHSSFSRANDEKYINVKTLTLSDIFKQNNINQCSLLKLDCEGAEFEILYNTPKEILKRIQKIVMEYHIISNNPNERLPKLISFLRMHGYKVTKCQENRQQANIGIIWAEQSNNN